MILEIKKNQYWIQKVLKFNLKMKETLKEDKVKRMTKI